MKQTQTEQRIRRAIEHAAPPMDEILSAAASRKETVLSMERRNNARTTPVKGKTQTRRRRNNTRSILTATLAAAAALVILFAGVTLFDGGNAVQSRITLDVNPSIGINVNKKERVLEVNALNERAADVIGTMDFQGTQLEVAVNALVGSMLQKGYLDASSNAILVSVEDSDAQHAADLESRISAAINGAFGGSEAAVLTQTIAAETETEKAAQYGISEGKAALIRSLVAQDETLTFETLAPLGVQEIALIAESRGLKAEGVQQTGTTASGGYIGSEAAEEFALKHAGLERSAVTRLHTELDSENGVMIYEVEFYAGSVEYDYDIDALTGEVRKHKTENEKRQTAAPAAPASDIGEAKAKQIALEHAGTKESEAKDLSVKLDRDDGRYEYDVKFTAGNVRYEFEIDAAAGEILQAERKELKTEKSSTSASDSSADIGAEKAKAIALDHAGLSAGEVTRLRAERDRENGVLVYEVEFRNGSMEYEYEIEAATGKIRKAEKERDD